MRGNESGVEVAGTATSGHELVLLVEDEADIAQYLNLALTGEGFRVAVAADGEAAIELFRAAGPEIVLLDIGLPKMSGLTVCRLLRAETSVPIMILSGRGSEADRLLGFEMGADDFLTKPFSFRELVSRMRVHLRHARVDERRRLEVVRAGPVGLDALRHEVRIRGVLVQLPPKEFVLLETLVRGGGRLCTRHYLLDMAWGHSYLGDTKTLDVHIRRLRNKIELDPHNPEHLLTVRGLGYRFGADARTIIGTAQRLASTRR